MSNVKVVKASILAAAVKKDGTNVIKAVSYETTVEDLDQLTANIVKCSSPDNAEKFHGDVADDALFIIRKAGKAFTPSVAFEPVTPFTSKPDLTIYGGIETLKVRYAPSLAKGFKAIDLVTKECEPSKGSAKKNSKNADALAALEAEGISPEAKAAVLEFMKLQALMGKKAKAVSETQTEAAPELSELADL